MAAIYLKSKKTSRSGTVSLFDHAKFAKIGRDTSEAVICELAGKHPVLGGA